MHNRDLCEIIFLEINYDFVIKKQNKNYYFKRLLNC